MHPKLEGYCAAILAELPVEQRQSVADELVAIDRLVESRGDLRAALTDTSIAPWARSAVLRDLLSAQVSAVTVRLAAYGALVSSGQDVPAALAGLAHYAIVRLRSEDHVPAPLSLLDARKRVAGFADAILEDLNVDIFGDIEDALFRWARTVEANNELRRILVDRDAGTASRQDMTRRLLEGKVNDATLRLSLYVIEGGRPRDVIGTLDFLVDYTAKARDWRVARVTSARELDDAARGALNEQLRAITGHSVDLQVAVEPSLLSGILIQVGDLRLDATTKGRLSALRETLEVSTTLLNRTI